jgi:hypothetical protein
VTAEVAGQSYNKQIRVADKGIAKEVFDWPEKLVQSAEPVPQLNRETSHSTNSQ